MAENMRVVNIWSTYFEDKFTADLSFTYFIIKFYPKLYKTHVKSTGSKWVRQFFRDFQRH